MIRKKDLLLIAVLLAVSLALLAFLRLRGQETGGMVRVTQAGQVIGAYDLATDRQIPLQTDTGYNLLVIQDGRAYMAEADCPDGYCLRQGKLPGTAEAIICLPHRLVVELVGDAPSDAPDAIAR